VHREMRAREAVELKNSCASFKNKCGERIFTWSCSSPGEVARVEEVRITKRRRRRSLQTWTGRRRRGELARCKCASGGKGRRLGERNRSSNAKLGLYKACPAQESALPSPFLPLSVSGS
jgi:hypothetical protein